MYEQRDVDSAYSLLLVDVLEHMLERAGDPARAAYSLSEQMRELTGARLVAVLRHDPRGGGMAFTAYPEQRKSLAESLEAQEFFSLAARTGTVTLWGTDTYDPAAERLLSARGLSNLISVPLLAGDLRIGTLVILDASFTGNLRSLTLTLDRLSRVMGLIIRNAGFYHEAERMVQDRTRKIESANAALTREIDERKAIEATLRESEEKFRVLADTSSAMIYVYQGENVVYVNNAAHDITGYSRSELLKMRFWDIIHPDFRELVRERGLARERGAHVPSHYEIKLLTKSGEEKWIELTAGRIEYAGKPAAVATFFDITDRKRAEEKLAAERERFFTLLDALPAFVYLQAPDHTIRFANSRFKQLFGEPENKPCHAVIQGLSEPCPECPTLEVLRTGKPVVWEWIKAKDQIYQIYDYPFSDVDGEPLVLEMGIDITDRKRAEEALEESRAKMELYLDLMTHDIRNNNQVAAGFLELALDTMPLDEPGRQLLAKPLDSIRASSALIDNVVKLQRVSNGQKLLSQPVDLCDILGRIQAAFREAGGSQVKITFNPTHASCIVLANGLIYDVFSNIVGNAIKHASPGKPPVIDIRLQQYMEGSQNYVKVTVEDNGPGIPDDLKVKLFSRYGRGRTKAQGRGLGLYLVRTLVRDLGGRVWVEDRVPGNPRGGARFVVLLPTMPEF